MAGTGGARAGTAFVEATNHPIRYTAISRDEVRTGSGSRYSNRGATLSRASCFDAARAARQHGDIG